MDEKSSLNDQIKRLYNEEKSFAEISRTLNCAPYVIRKILVAESVKIRKRQQIRPIHIPDSTEKLAYLAGILDGEGSIDFIINKKRRREKVAPRVRVSNTDIKLINWLLKEIGGYIGNYWTPKFGHKPAYEWVITGEQNIRGLLNSLLPYLIIKQENAKEIIRFYEECHQKGVSSS